jgi:ubiquitin carboxyl-terminal hydrolase 4/11/15
MDNGFGASSVRRVEKGGLAGLQNMGVHTPQLVEYFLQDYSEEINTQNPLGMHVGGFAYLLSSAGYSILIF